MDSEKTNKTQLYYNIAKRSAIVSAIFAAILAILLIANFIQTQSAGCFKSLSTFANRPLYETWHLQTGHSSLSNHSILILQFLSKTSAFLSR